MSTTTTEKWLEEQRKHRGELRARQAKVVEDAMEAVEKIIQKNGEDQWSLTQDIAQKLISKLRKHRARIYPLKIRKDVFPENNISTKRVEIDVTGKQGILAGDIRITGKIIKVDGNHAIIRIPKKNIMGWTK